MRTATAKRVTSETSVEVSLNLDGTGVSDIRTGIGFFDHMLTQIARHGRLDLTLVCSGDLHIDCHHTVEDTGIVLGRAFREALGDCSGIQRFADGCTPMDGSLVLVALDISGRPYLQYELALTSPLLGQFETETVEEFFSAFVNAAGITLHIRSLSQGNTHHQIEAAFKGFARMIRSAVAKTENDTTIPSSKGCIE